MNEVKRDYLIIEISNILNDTGAYNQIIDEMIAKGFDVDISDSDIFREIEEFIVDKLGEKEI